MDSERLSNECYRQLAPEGLASLLPPQREKEDINLVKKLCKKTDRILDLACGYGRVILPLAKSGYDIRGIDLSPQFIKKAKIDAKRKNVKVRLETGNMLRLPYANNTFDKIICLWSSFQLLLIKREQINALNEIFRVLCSYGFAFVEMINGEKKYIRQMREKEGQGPDKNILQGLFIGKNGCLKMLCYFHNRATLSNICQNSKFKHYRIGFKNLYKERRLVLYLYK